MEKKQNQEMQIINKIKTGNQENLNNESLY